MSNLSEPTVSVVVPTYKRAHLIEQTLPTYLQDNVIEMIVIDDASPDNTPAVMANMVEQDARIRYFRQAQNMGQTMAKNRGKALARGDYIYFADDDSVLVPGSMAALLESAAKHPKAIIGAAAVYMHHDESSPALAAARRHPVQNAREIVDLPRLFFRFDTVCDRLLAVPVCHASFLIETEQAQRLDFDHAFRGNCYREETDFLLRYRALGQPIFFDSRAVQVNLPVTQATGGARKRFWKTEYFIMVNTLLMLKRNRQIIQQLAPEFSTVKALSALLADRVGGVMRRNQARGKKLLKKLNLVAV